MATKTISVDLEAYEKLRTAKATARESFSEVIKRASWVPKAGTARHLLTWLAATPERVSDESLDELDRLQEADLVAPDRWQDLDEESSTKG